MTRDGTSRSGSPWLAPSWELSSDFLPYFFFTTEKAKETKNEHKEQRRGWDSPSARIQEQKGAIKFGRSMAQRVSKKKKAARSAIGFEHVGVQCRRWMESHFQSDQVSRERVLTNISQGCNSARPFPICLLPQASHPEVIITLWAG